MPRFSSYVTQRIKEKNLTLQQVAKECHISRHTVSHWVNAGENPIKIAHVFKLAELLETPYSYLFWLLRPEEHTRRYPSYTYTDTGFDPDGLAVSDTLYVPRSETFTKQLLIKNSSA